MVGRPVLRSEEITGGAEIKDIVVGAECARLRHALEVKYPLEKGMIKDWEDAEHLWNHTFFDVLGLEKGNLGDSKVMLTEPPSNPTQNRKKMVETMFEKYGFGGVYVATQAVLTLYAQGLWTGVVCDSGDGVTHVVPVYEGFCLRDITSRLNIAGRTITERMIKLLLQRGYSFNRTADFDTVRQIKEKFCYVGYDLDVESKLALETTVLMREYTLPDGRVIKLGAERFEAPEALFNPDLVGVESVGMHELIFNTINNAAMDVRPKLYEHIVLSGGTTMYPGLPSRLEKEITNLYINRVLKGDKSRLSKKSFDLSIEDPPRRKHMVFLGGAVLAGIMADRNEFWLTKQEYEERGVIEGIKKFG